MVNLEASSPCQDMLPLKIGGIALTEVILPEGKVWSVSPSPVAAGRANTTKAVRILWIGRDHALQIGGARPKSGITTEQADAWACVSISGEQTLEVMARLCPVDLSKLTDGAVIRSQLNHLTAIIAVTPEGLDLFVFRAFAKTLVDELKEAAELIAGRHALVD